MLKKFGCWLLCLVLRFMRKYFSYCPDPRYPWSRVQCIPRDPDPPVDPCAATVAPSGVAADDTIGVAGGATVTWTTYPAQGLLANLVVQVDGTTVASPVPAAVSADITGLTPGVNVAIRVGAIFSNGCPTLFSNSVSFTPGFPPGVPTGLASAQSGNCIELTWTLASGEPTTSLDFQRQNVRNAAGTYFASWVGFSPDLPDVNGPALDCDLFLDGQDGIEYRVRAVGDHGASDWAAFPPVDFTPSP